MTLLRYLKEVNYRSRYSGSILEVPNTGFGDEEFLTSSPYNIVPKSINNVQNCLALALINHTQKTSQLLELSPRPAMVRTGYTTSPRPDTYYVSELTERTARFRSSIGRKEAVVLGGVNTNERIDIDLGSSIVKRSDIYQASLDLVASTLRMRVEQGPSNPSNNYMFWVGLIYVAGGLEIQYINTLALNKAVPTIF